MPYCHECGAEAAKTDMYCSICGIAMEFPGEIIAPESELPSAETEHPKEELLPQSGITAEAEDVPIPSIIAEDDTNLIDNPSDVGSSASIDDVVKEIEHEVEVEASEVEANEEIDSSEENLDETTPDENEKAEETQSVEPETDETVEPQVENETPDDVRADDNAFGDITDYDNAESKESVELAELQDPEYLSVTKESHEEVVVQNADLENEADIDDLIEQKIIETKAPETEADSEVSDVFEDTFAESGAVDPNEAAQESKPTDTVSDNFESTIPYDLLDIEMLNLKNSHADEENVDLGEVIDEENLEAESREAISEDVAENETPIVEQGESEVVENIEVVAESLPEDKLGEKPETVDNSEKPSDESVQSEAVESPAKDEGSIAEEVGSDVAGKPEFVDESVADSDQPIVIEPEMIESAPVEPSPAVAVPIVSAESEYDDRSRPYTSQVREGVDTGGKSKQLKPLEEGTLLNGRYEVVRKIGGGGMGAVYLASDRNLGGVLRAVKEMVQAHIEEEQQDKAIHDFRRESLLLTSLEHPSIPTIYDYFFDDREGRFYLVMKYISGGDLAGRMRSNPEGRIDEKSVVEWAIQVADVLDYLHNRVPSIIYRDLKPSNIMIDGNSGRVMLIDFGIARWVNIEEKGVTAVGTMGYAPPELFSGNVEPRSDIYSLGSTMFHMLTGADPQNSPLLIFDFNKNPRPRQINPNLSDQIEQILMKSVEYNTEKRFASAAQMRDAMIQHLENLKSGKVTYGVSDGVSASILQPNQPVFCGFCGQKIVSSDMFCPFCGAKQPMAMQNLPGIPNSVFVSPSISARLVLLATNDLDSPSYNLDKDSNLIGRRDPMSNIFPEVDLTKYDPQTKISRRHARLWREGDMFMVEDLGSSNGTSLNTSFNELIRLLPHQPRVIAHGDKIKIGDTTLHFVVG